MMRKIDLIVIHCSATRADRSLTPDDLEMQHRRRGFNGTGYHYYIRKDGTVHLTRPIERIGAHVKGFNSNSVGICYEGGLPTVVRQTRGHRNNGRHSAYWYINYLRLSPVAGCAVIGI